MRFHGRPKAGASWEGLCIEQVARHLGADDRAARSDPIWTLVRTDS